MVKTLLQESSYPKLYKLVVPSSESLSSKPLSKIAVVYTSKNGSSYILLLAEILGRHHENLLTLIYVFEVDSFHKRPEIKDGRTVKYGQPLYDINDLNASYQYNQILRKQNNNK